ncbi:hypothetical protein Tco_0390131 [Tanacetum coccineum]|uniref:Uncharacterized protein n=1 Tax=Tanacetum coccineum TaxID=301880 RepID=A0ABQ5CW12_9ASTR
MRCGRRELVLPPTARNPGGFRADYGFVATIDKEIKQDLERDVSYGITDTWEEILVDMPGAPTTNDTELGQWMTEFATRIRQSPQMRLWRIGRITELQQRTAGDRPPPPPQSPPPSSPEVAAVDRKRQAQFIEALKLLKRLQTQMTEFKR